MTQQATTAPLGLAFAPGKRRAAPGFRPPPRTLRRAERPMTPSVLTRIGWTVALVAGVVVFRVVAAALLRRRADEGPLHRDAAARRFVVKQVVGLLVLAVVVGGTLEIWFDDPG